MGEMLFMAHSGVRYLVLLAGLLAAVLAALSLRGRNLSGAAETVGRVFVGVIDLQVLLGIAVVLTRPFFPQLIGHIVLMVAAAAVAHGVWAAVKRRPVGARPAGLWLGGVVGALALMVGGILAIGRAIV
jgi:hypothetical protein